ncbi:glycosyltransferase family 2 protein [Trichocoleus desertorum AS-A10]|uniref:glycosyltransferase n=1 Tax=Trichocoleus desertorum TaxID=1481672 RepID=UPI0032979EFA
MKSTASATPQPLSAQLNLLAFLFFPILGLTGLYVLQNPGNLAIWDVFGLISLGVVGVWRWAWFLLRLLRSRIYLHWVFPKWRRWANKVPVEHLPHVCLLVPTYKEKPWITERVFRAIAREARDLVHPITVLVSSSSDEENASIVEILKAEDPELKTVRLVLMTQKDGKRKAMADGLRELAQLNLPADTIVALMDGDSELAPGTLRQCLPFFLMFPKMGALTTDELPVVQGSYLFSEWFHLRFAQRHSQMCSDSLSRKVMCLTGRFSLFRAEAALHPTFAMQLENDTLDDWLWGQFKFLSGDDKSTWFWLLQRGYEMLYIPDVVVYSIETISGSFVDRAYQNMRRWYGNMLRNNNRAIALGPHRIGWTAWYSLLDQRISIWTSLITPGLLVISFLQGNWVAVGIISSWICFSRPLMLLLIFWGRSSELRPIHFPILLLSQWASALVKVWTLMNLAKQNWSNRGNQSISAEGSGLERAAKLGTSRFLLGAQAFSFVIFLLWLSGSLSPIWDLEGWWLNRQVVAQQMPLEIVEAIDRGVIPNDNRDDSAALQALIARLPQSSQVQINLPIGEIDLFQPVEINRSDIKLKGQGMSRTILQAHFDREAGEAVLSIQPKGQGDRVTKATAQPVSHTAKAVVDKLRNVELSGFTMRQILPKSAVVAEYAIDSIYLRQVEQATVKNLHLERSGRNPLVLNSTQDVTVEYVAVDGSLNRGEIVMEDAVNTQTKGVTLPTSLSQGA